MGIKNTKLGGTDFNTPTERIRPSDLNDTFDASAGWLDAIGMIFKNQSQLLYNSALIGLDSNLYEDFKNLYYDEDLSDAISDGADFAKAPFVPRSLIDEHDDSSVDTDLWTPTSSNGGSVTENTSYLDVDYQSSGENTSGNATATLNGTSAPEVGNGTLIIKGSYRSASFSSDDSAYARIQIYDGSGTVNIFSSSASGASDTNIGDFTYRFNINKDNKTANRTSDLTDTDDTSIDLSPLNNTQTWYLRYSVGGTHGSYPSSASAYLRINVTSKIDPEDSADFVIGTHTASETINDGILVENGIDDNNGATKTVSVSVDNGSNFESVTPNEIHRFTNTGTQARFKFTLNASNDTYPYITDVKHMAFLYNITGA